MTKSRMHRFIVGMDENDESAVPGQGRKLSLPQLSQKRFAGNQQSNTVLLVARPNANAGQNANGASQLISLGQDKTTSKKPSGATAKVNSGLGGVGGGGAGSASDKKPGAADSNRMFRRVPSNPRNGGKTGDGAGGGAVVTGPLPLPGGPPKRIASASAELMSRKLAVRNVTLGKVVSRPLTTTKPYADVLSGGFGSDRARGLLSGSNTHLQEIKKRREKKFDILNAIDIIQKEIHEHYMAYTACVDIFKQPTAAVVEHTRSILGLAKLLAQQYPKSQNILGVVGDLLWKCGVCVLEGDLRMPTFGLRVPLPEGEDGKMACYHYNTCGEGVNLMRPSVLPNLNHRYREPDTPESTLPETPGLQNEVVHQMLERVFRKEVGRNCRLVYDSAEMIEVEDDSEHTPPPQKDRLICPDSDVMNGEDPAAVNRPRMKLVPAPPFEPCSPDDLTLVFESRFECGNLRKAIKTGMYEYTLILEPDINTKGWMQWFYFSVSNMRKDVAYTFSIINMTKPQSLFKQGMQPVVYSVIDSCIGGRGWFRSGGKISYVKNFHRKAPGEEGRVNTCTFNVEFGHDKDICYVACGIPYSYTNLQKDLAALEKKSMIDFRMQRLLLCRSLGGNRLEYLKITSFNSSQKEIDYRPHIVVTARVHPAETNASWMMKGLIDFLTGSSQEAQDLRDKYVFDIIPMLNPDGVANGNSRCSLAGVDLNRQWKSPSRRHHPEIYFTKALLKELSSSSPGVSMYLDMHGHSTKKNIFLFGCNNIHNRSVYLSERVFPRLLSEKNDNFSFEESSFLIQRTQEGTGRVVVWHEFNITNTYTMEASFCGPDSGPNKDTHFHPGQLQEAGAHLGQTILEYRAAELKQKERSAPSYSR